MSLRSVPFFLLVLVVTEICGQDAKKDLDELQGEWTMFSRETNGKPSTNTNWKLIIKGDEWRVTRINDDVSALQATIKLDSSKTPKEINLGDRPGIYKLEGDTLTFCRPAQIANVERPKEFNSASPNEIIVWKRAMKK